MLTWNDDAPQFLSRHERELLKQQTAWQEWT